MADGAEEVAVAVEAGAVEAGVVAVVNFSRYERKTELTSPTTGQ